MSGSKSRIKSLSVQEPEQTEALPLVVSTPKKKRSKVTDTRLSPRAARALLQDGLRQQAIDAFPTSTSVSLPLHCFNNKRSM